MSTPRAPRSSRRRATPSPPLADPGQFVRFFRASRDRTRRPGSSVDGYGQARRVLADPGVHLRPASPWSCQLVTHAPRAAVGTLGQQVLHDVLSQRRTIRAYRDQTVPRDVLQRMRTRPLCVRRAPASARACGWSWSPIRTSVGRSPRPVPRTSFAAKGRPRWKAAAPVHVVVLVREDDYHDRYRKADKLAVTDGREIDWSAPYWYVDAGAAMMLLMLGAIAEGLAASVFGVTDIAALREALALPDDLHFVAVVTMGYPAARTRTSSDGSRRRSASGGSRASRSSTGSAGARRQTPDAHERRADAVFPAVTPSPSRMRRTPSRRDAGRVIDVLDRVRARPRRRPSRGPSRRTWPRRFGGTCGWPGGACGALEGLARLGGTGSSCRGGVPLCSRAA